MPMDRCQGPQILRFQVRCAVSGQIRRRDFAAILENSSELSSSYRFLEASCHTRPVWIGHLHANDLSNSPNTSIAVVAVRQGIIVQTKGLFGVTYVYTNELRKSLESPRAWQQARLGARQYR